ncbi:MAG: hypothetical protein CUN56_10120 [Phototrophicales bacterium]|nr:MAG: hypothetical protein CUN56_10120 [Phototrophicales bacterium]RMG74667.1 MAG: serine protease [Chloroflexota bacterium]
MRRVILLLGLLFGVVTVNMAQLSVREIAQRVVLIGIIENGEFVGNGSGTIVTPTGLIYTNRHVVEEAQDLAIFMLEDIQELPVLRYYASPVAVYEDIDFAIIQIDRDENGRPLDQNTLNLPFLPPSDTPVDIGDEVTIYGYPSIGDGYMVVTSGRIVTIQNGWINGERMPVWYRTDSEFSGGNSGGLVVNENGEFVGLPTWVVSEDRTAGKLGGILPMLTVNAVIAGENTTTNNAPPSNQQDVVFLLQNHSDQVICYVFISPTTSNEWGPDQLGQEEVITQDGSRAWQVIPGFYDVLLQDCDRNTLDDIRNIDMTTDGYTLTYTGTGESVRELEDNPVSVPTGAVRLTNLPDTRAQVTCEDGTQFDNGFEFVIGQLELGRTYVFTAIGINGFDPVLAVINNDTGEGLCVGDTPDAAYFRANLPTTGEVPPNTLSAQAVYSQNTGQPPSSLSVVVGSPFTQTGEFLLIVEGQSVSSNDGDGDIISIRLTPGMIASGVPLTVYMMSTQTQLDSYMFLMAPDTGEPFVTPDGETVICDDAGGTVCWGQSENLAPYSVSISGGLRLNGGNLDTMLQIPLAGLSVADATAPRYFNFSLTSYQQQTQGDYVIVVHAGTQ